MSRKGSIYATENLTLKFNLEKLLLESTVQLFVSILDASNVVNGVPLEYVTLHAINYCLKKLLV